MISQLLQSKPFGTYRKLNTSQWLQPSIHIFHCLRFCWSGRNKYAATHTKIHFPLFINLRPESQVTSHPPRDFSFFALPPRLSPIPCRASPQLCRRRGQSPDERTASAFAPRTRRSASPASSVPSRSSPHMWAECRRKTRRVQYVRREIEAGLEVAQSVRKKRVRRAGRRTSFLSAFMQNRARGSRSRALCLR